MREDELLERDVEAYLALQQKKEILRFLTAGSVDDGKSTLIGRLLHDANTVYDDQLAALHKDSAKKSSAGGAVDYSLLVDGLISEREQGITIDVAYRYFATEKRKFIIADTPGHEQYTRNMATGASTADLAVFLIDARTGVLPQTRRHSFIASLLGIRHVVVAVNKMDLVGYDQAVFSLIAADYAAFARELALGDVHYLPLSALAGDNVVAPSDRMPWYEGPPLLRYLETVPIARDRSVEALRFPVQYVLRPDLDFRGFSGTVASGVLRRGATVMSLPSRRTSTVARIVTYDGDREEAFAPEAVTVTLTGEIDVSRGDMLVSAADDGAPSGRSRTLPHTPGALPHVDRTFEAMVVWMHETELRPGASYLVKLGTQVVSAEVTTLHERVDVNTMERVPAAVLGLNDIGRVTLSAARPLLFDAYAESRATGAFILIDRLTNGTYGAGMILGPGASPMGTGTGDPIDSALRGVSLGERLRRLGQGAAAVVLSGDDAARQAALAHALERRLWDDGYTAHVLGPREVGALAVCQRLGMISIVLADGSTELPALDAGALMVACDRETSVAAVMKALRGRDVIR
jgi:bifunctional enzyme CysN/CysC